MRSIDAIVNTSSAKIPSMKTKASGGADGSFTVPATAAVEVAAVEEMEVMAADVEDGAESTRCMPGAFPVE